MQLLTDLTLALLDRVAGAQARRELALRAVMVLTAGTCLAAGAAFLIAAAFWGLSDRYGPAPAAAMVGAMLAVAGGLLLAVNPHRQAAIPRAPLISAAPLQPGAIAGGTAATQTLVTEFNRVFKDGGPLAAAFFFCGVSAGLLSRWVLVRRT